MFAKSARLATVLTCFCLFICVSTAGVWSPPAGSDMDWCNPVNWGYSGVPGPTNTVAINSTPNGPALIGVTCPAAAARLIISQFGSSAALVVTPGGQLHVYNETILGNYSQTGRLEVQGFVDIDGHLTVGYYMPMGTSPRGIGDLDIRGGQLTVGGDLLVGDDGGYGTIDMTGGLLDVTGVLTMLNGKITLSGGVFHVADLTFFPPNGTFDIRNDATLVVWKDYRNTYGLGLGSITACGGQAQPIIDYYSNATVVRAGCACPDADVTGDCRVNLEDLAALADTWLADAE